MPYTYPGQAYDHTLLALKGWYREMALDAEVAIGSNVNLNSTSAPVTMGLVVHAVSVNAALSPYGESITGPGTYVVEMGCKKGHGMPMYLWSSPQDPDVSNPGVIAGDPAYGVTSRPPEFVSILPRITGQNLVALVASGGYELEDTEYDTAQSYNIGDPLRAVSSNTDANGGKLTNQGATSDAFTTATFLYGDPTLSAWDTIVGVTSRGVYTNANRRTAIAFWSTWIPGTR